ncbi:MAG: winged helix-turn-helix transcriptional regulator [Steroidobacteraceae bacterium]
MIEERVGHALSHPLLFFLVGCPLVDAAASLVRLAIQRSRSALRQTRGTIRTDAPNWQPWLLVFRRSLAEQVRRLEKKVEREKIVLAALPGLSLQIVEFAREHGRITMAEAIKLTGASRNTLKQHLRDLTERNHLEQHGSGRGVWHGLR